MSNRDRIKHLEHAVARAKWILSSYRAVCNCDPRNDKAAQRWLADYIDESARIFPEKPVARCASCNCPIDDADHHVCDPCFYGPRMSKPKVWAKELEQRRKRYGWRGEQQP